MNQRDLLNIEYQRKSNEVYEEGVLKGRNKLKTVYGLNDCFRSIETRIEDLLCRNEYLKDTIKELENYNKNDEVEELKKELKLLKERSMYCLSEKQKQQVDKFNKEHYMKHPCKYTSSYILTSTGIGTVVTIKCNKCGEELDVTDYDLW